MKFMKATLQRGISLLEVMLSLSIIAIILVMATRYFFTASQSQDNNQFMSQIATLQAQIGSWHAGRASYSGLAIGQVAPTTSPAWDGTALSNPWGNSVGVASTNGDKNYKITGDMKSLDACKSFQGRFQPEHAGTAVVESEPGSYCTGTGTFTYIGPNGVSGT